MDFKREDFYGLTFHWYAVDADELIAKFISGFGVIPKNVFADRLLYEKVDNYFENLPANKKYILSPFAKIVQQQSRESDNSVWYEAMKGLYIYDEKDYGHDYDLLSSPKSPIIFSQQPNEIRKFLSSFFILDVKFNEQKQIDPRNYFECFR